MEKLGSRSRVLPREHLDQMNPPMSLLTDSTNEFNLVGLRGGLLMKTR